MDRLRSLPIRLLAIVVALLLAAVATFALRDWLRDVEADRLAEVELVEVLVAKDNIAPGTTVEEAITAGAFDLREFPANSIPPNAMSSLDGVAGLVVATPLYAGDILQPARFAATAAVGQFVEIPPGLQAITFSVPAIEGVANLINPGDRINILAHLIPGDEETTVNPDGTEETVIVAEGETRTRIMLQDILVLQKGRRVTTVDATTGQASEGLTRPDDQVILTVAVTAEQAEQIAFATREASLHLTLLPELEEGELFEPADTDGRTRDNLYDN